MEKQASGQVSKMASRLESPVAYAMRLSDQAYPLNELIGGTIRLVATGLITCVHCGRKTNKSFNQGYCYPCFQRLAQCDSCIIHPERCHFDGGTCREPEWGEKYCMQDHIVYLANSSGLKVGITRATQVPTRWIDQGATQALAILRVRSRLQSGHLEVMFKQHAAAKTNFRDMLKGVAAEVDLVTERDRLLSLCNQEIEEYRQRFGFFSYSVINGIETQEINYPVEQYPETVKVHNFDKESLLEGTLTGIKGQYLILDSAVVNIRRFSGYEIELWY